MESNKRHEELFILESNLLEVVISDFGASIQAIRFKNTKGYMQDLCLNYISKEERVRSHTYCGAVIGRVANRIAKASFELNGEKYHLPANDGENTLHGGDCGFDRRLFDGSYEDGAVVMRYVSPDGEQGFPGTLMMNVTFRVEGNSLQVQFCAGCDKDTVWAPTIHPYFNFGGYDIFDTYFKINADKYTPTSDNLIPTGEIVPVKDTVFDFRQPKKISKDLFLTDKQLMATGGYDHNFVLNGSHAATVFNRESGILMDVHTDFPGMQFYTGNHLNGFKGHRNVRKYEGFALEPQYFPDAINQPNFEKPILKAGEIKTNYIKFAFFTFEKQ